MQPAGGKCSIMLRSLKSTSKCTQESADAAFQREEVRARGQEALSCAPSRQLQATMSCTCL